MSSKIAISFILAVMAALYIHFLPSLNVDRVQEDVYLGIPYQYLLEDRLVLNGNDPFAEMGPHSVYPPAWLLLKSGSLRLVRYYQFAFSLLVMALLFNLLKRYFNIPSKHTIPLAFLMVAAWISIPLSMTYPTQTNGMTAGFACVLIGLLIVERHPFLAMLSFGFAYSFKGQFLAFFPGLMLYFILFDQQHPFGWRWLVQLLLAALVYFVPSSLIVPLAAQALGMFEKPGDFAVYALQGPNLLRMEVTHVIERILGKPLQAEDLQAALRAAECRRTEYRGYGLLAWGHVALSAGSCVSYFLFALWKTARAGFGRFSGLNPSFVLFSIVGSLYWANFLFFYGYPYWYNVFAVIFLNIFLVAAGFLWICDYSQKTFGRNVLRAVCWLALVGSLALIGKDVARYEKVGAHGTSLTPYPWMKK